MVFKLEATGKGIFARRNNPATKPHYAIHCGCDLFFSTQEKWEEHRANHPGKLDHHTFSSRSDKVPSYLDVERDQICIPELRNQITIQIHHVSGNEGEIGALASELARILNGRGR